MTLLIFTEHVDAILLHACVLLRKPLKIGTTSLSLQLLCAHNLVVLFEFIIIVPTKDSVVGVALLMARRKQSNTSLGHFNAWHDNA